MIVDERLNEKILLGMITLGTTTDAGWATFSRSGIIHSMGCHISRIDLERTIHRPHHMKFISHLLRVYGYTV